MSLLNICSFIVLLCFICKSSAESSGIKVNQSIPAGKNAASSSRQLPDLGNPKNAMLHVMQCIFQKSDRTVCFLDRAQRALDVQREKLLAQADEETYKYQLLHGGAAARGKNEEKPSSVAAHVTDLIKELSEMLQDSIGSFFTALKTDDSTKDVDGNSTDVTEADDDDDDDEEEDEDANDTETRANKSVATRSGKSARKKKKKFGKIKKLIALIKVLVSAAVLKGALDTLLKLISTHLLKKFFVLALISVLIHLTRFWLDKKLEPQKVIYYENAHHQHHYETPEEHLSHGSGSWWGSRSFDTKQNIITNTSPSQSPHHIAYNAYIPNQ